MVGLEIHPSDLRSRANEIDRQRQNFLDAMKRLRVLVMGLNESWKGKSQAAFVTKFTNNQPMVTQLSQTLSEYITLAKEAATEAENGDNELLSTVNKI